MEHVAGIIMALAFLLFVISPVVLIGWLMWLEYTKG